MSGRGDGKRRDRFGTSSTPTGVYDAVLTAAPTALPSVFARIVAFAAIVVSAVCGGLVGYAISAFECSRGCVGPSLAGAAIGALAAAVGVAAVAALVLRSMSEWADQASVTHRRRRWPLRRPPANPPIDDKAAQQ
ncbi:hypothetical protein [Candidatus Poriferisodalis sp.]|uniref:hypothetical protein n=1 Tax=Candidatus Poriferisodalis sp. TaxID=3101277 RepID=UPI003B01A744